MCDKPFGDRGGRLISPAEQDYFRRMSALADEIDEVSILHQDDEAFRGRSRPNRIVRRASASAEVDRMHGVA